MLNQLGQRLLQTSESNKPLSFFPEASVYTWVMPLTLSQAAHSSAFPALPARIEPPGQLEVRASIVI